MKRASVNRFGKNVVSRAEEKRKPMLLPGPIYVYLCTGEVVTIDEAENVELDVRTLKVLCPDCREVCMPRKGVYMCSRLENLPPVPD